MADQEVIDQEVKDYEDVFYGDDESREDKPSSLIPEKGENKEEETTFDENQMTETSIGENQKDENIITNEMSDEENQEETLRNNRRRERSTSPTPSARSVRGRTSLDSDEIPAYLILRAEEEERAAQAEEAMLETIGAADAEIELLDFRRIENSKQTQLSRSEKIKLTKQFKLWSEAIEVRNWFTVERRSFIRLCAIVCVADK